jgi:hypothetical protein
MAARPAGFGLLGEGVAPKTFAAVPFLVFAAPFIIMRNTLRGAKIERRRFEFVMMATIIAGATATEIPDLYVYDNLIGVRQNCPTLQRSEMYRAADYIEFMVPRFGPIERQLGILTSTAVRVSDVKFEFDGRTEHLMAYFNPMAAHTPVPAKLHDPCPPGR